MAEQTTRVLQQRGETISGNANGTHNRGVRVQHAAAGISMAVAALDHPGFNRHNLAAAIAAKAISATRRRGGGWLLRM